MKNKLKIISFLAFGALMFTTCQKDPKLPMPDLQVGVIPKVTKDQTKDQNVSFLNLDGFNAAVIVDLYYKDAPKSMDLMVCMNDDIANTAVVKSDISSFPTTSDAITIASLVTMLPGLNNKSELKLGDTFKFYVDMTLKDGTVIKGNDTTYSSFNTSVANLPGSSLRVTYTVACPLNPAMTYGSYRAVCGDWGVDGNVTITVDPVDPNKVYVKGLEEIDGCVEDKGPLVMHIDPLTYVVTADKTILASVTGWGPPYHNIAYEGKGTYNTCTGTYEMTFTISVTEGNFGDFAFTLTRN